MGKGVSHSSSSCQNASSLKEGGASALLRDASCAGEAMPLVKHQTLDGNPEQLTNMLLSGKTRISHFVSCKIPKRSLYFKNEEC